MRVAYTHCVCSACVLMHGCGCQSLLLQQRVMWSRKYAHIMCRPFVGVLARLWAAGDLLCCEGFLALANGNMSSAINSPAFMRSRKYVHILYWEI